MAENKTKKTSITIPIDLLIKVKERALMDGIKQNDVMIEAIKQYIN